MGPSIRDVLKRKIRRFFAIGLLGWLCAALAIPLRQGRVPKGDMPPLALIVGFCLMGVAVLLIQRVKCLKCATALGQIAPAIGLSWRRKVNFCMTLPRRHGLHPVLSGGYRHKGDGLERSGGDLGLQIPR
jgi:hypothetical protein